MGNILSSRQSQKDKTSSHELETPSDGRTLPLHETATPAHNTELVPPSCPNTLKGGFEQEFHKLKPELKVKVVEYGDAIQPHTDEGGEAYYIGDAYEDVKATWANEWKVEK